MRNMKRRGLQHVLQLAIVITLLVPSSARAQQPELYIACENGMPIALRLVLPAAGMVTLGLPLTISNLCADVDEPEDKSIEPTPPPADLPETHMPAQTARV